ncbi:MAG: hypothetical protein QF707_03565 [Candidatus Poseidoniaceae archaeon]|nr:hypothetical protein [Candidatus Poseidoniaceae archaeon]MDP7203561.1 hypothetical protein [Candidatus Poseidoniaceae archaeon]
MTEQGDEGPNDWEEQMLNKLAEMFKQMGMDVNASTLKDMMGQFQKKFEELGIDPEKIAKDGVNLNFDLSKINKMFSEGGNLQDMLSNLGFDVQVDAKPTEIPVPVDDDTEQVKQLAAADVYLDGWEMAITVDCTTEVELEENIIELELIEKGSLLEILRSTQVTPVARIELPHQCDELVDWSFNNGILDVTLKLTPQGSAASEDDEDNEDEDGADEDDEIPDVSIDFSDDDEDDGGIPIL